MAQNELFPVFLKTDRLRFLVVGGGEVAREKLQFLLKSSPNSRVVVVARVISPAVAAILAANPSITVFRRGFRNEDLDIVDVAIVAINDHRISSYIRDEAKDRGVLINVADDPE